MNPRISFFLLFLLLIIVAAGIFRWRKEPRRKEMLERKPVALAFSPKARCQMDCLELEEGDIRAVLRAGIIHLNRSDRRASPCPKFLLLGSTVSGRYLQLQITQCPDRTQITACHEPKEKKECDCP